MILLQMSKPKPVPAPEGFVVKKGSKILSLIDSSIPAPLSLIATSQVVETLLQEISIFPLYPIE